MSTTSLFTKALLTKYESQYNEAHAHLVLYLTNSVGIGEHSNLLEECDKFIKQMVDASDNKKMVLQLMNQLKANNQSNESKQMKL